MKCSACSSSHFMLKQITPWTVEAMCANCETNHVIHVVQDHALDGEITKLELRKI